MLLVLSLTFPSPLHISFADMAFLVLRILLLTSFVWCVAATSKNVERHSSPHSLSISHSKGKYSSRGDQGMSSQGTPHSHKTHIFDLNMLPSENESQSSRAESHGNSGSAVNRTGKGKPIADSSEAVKSQHPQRRLWNAAVRISQTHSSDSSIDISHNDVTRSGSKKYWRIIRKPEEGKPMDRTSRSAWEMAQRALSDGHGKPATKKLPNGKIVNLKTSDYLWDHWANDRKYLIPGFNAPIEECQTHHRKKRT